MGKGTRLSAANCWVRVYEIVNTVFKTFYAPTQDNASIAHYTNSETDCFLFFEEESSVDATDEFKMYCQEKLIELTH